MPFKNTKPNMSHAEKLAIRTLSNNKRITIKPFDKGRGIAIINKTDYINECNRQLYNEKYYTKLTANDTLQTVEKIHEIIKVMYENKHIDYDTYKYLDPHNMIIRTPQWYLLPKIHKNPPMETKFAGRPIISGCSSPTSRISEFLDFYIKPIVQHQPTYIKDTTQFIQTLEGIEVPANAQLVTLDIVSMYTNTLHNEAMILVGQALDSERSRQLRHKITQPPTEYMVAYCLT